MLVLLIIFMVITPMLQQGVSVDLAKVNNPERCPTPTRKMPCWWRSCATAKSIFGTDKIRADQLTHKVKDRLASRTDKRVFIKADARARYGSVVEVVDNVRAAGVDDLGSADRPEAKPDSRHAGRPHRQRRARRTIEEIRYGNGSRPAEAKARTQRNPADRRAAGAVDHLHGDHAADAEGPGRAGAPAAAAQRRPKNNTPDRTIVVQVIDRGAGQKPGLKINQEDVTWDNLQGRLTEIFKTRAEKVMFVKGDDNVSVCRRGQCHRHRPRCRRGQSGADHRQDRSPAD